MWIESGSAVAKADSNRNSNEDVGYGIGMHATVIGGAGSVGSTVAYTLATTVSDLDLRLVDIVEGSVAGHRTDIAHATNHITHEVGQSLPPALRSESGSVSTMTPGPEAVRDTDCLIVVYNVSRTEDAVGRGGRESYYEQNRPVADELGEWMATTDPRPVIVVTNPVDRITHRLWKRSGWPRRRFVGYSLSETARAAAEIGRIRNVDPHAVWCPILGEHGERIVPVFSKTTISGDSVDLSVDERQQVLDYVREVPYEVMRQRGPGESSRWVSGRGVAAVAHAIERGGTAGPVCLSVPLDGEYGYRNVSMSVPVILSSDGWDRIERWQLSEWERDRLEAASESL